MFNDDEGCRNNEEMTKTFFSEKTYNRVLTICRDDEQSVKAKLE